MKIRYVEPLGEMGDRQGESAAQLMQDVIMKPASKIAESLRGRSIPAKDLTDIQRTAIIALAGLTKLEKGRLVSTRLVAVVDDGAGWYRVAVAEE